MSQLEDTFAFQLRAYHIKFEREVRFAPPRRFRFDFLIGKLAVEIMGGTYVQGGHSRGKGQTKDAEKNYLALLAGYRILYLTTDHISSGIGIQWVKSLLGE
jgi:hypothetical protein